MENGDCLYLEHWVSSQLVMLVVIAPLGLRRMRTEIRGLRFTLGMVVAIVNIGMMRRKLAQIATAPAVLGLMLYLNILTTFPTQMMNLTIPTPHSTSPFLTI